MRLPVPALATAFLAACAGSPGPAGVVPGGAAGAVLAHGVPEPNPALYEHADTTDINLRIAGMGDVDVSIGTHTLMELQYESAADGVDVTATPRELAGRMTNSMTGTIEVGSEAMPGPARLRVDGRGDVTVVEASEFEGPLAQIASSESLFRAFFAALPGREVRRGTAWTDTLRIEESAADMTTARTQIVTSTWTTDTVVGGSTVLVIESDIVSTVAITGSTQGVEMRQNLTGTAQARTLWDPARRVVVHRTETGEATGTADIPGAGVTGLPMTARSRQTLRLRSQGG